MPARGRMLRRCRLARVLPMPFAKFFQLIDLIHKDPEEGLVWETFQSCGLDSRFEYRGRVYEEYLAASANVGATTSISGENRVELVLPWGNSRELAKYSSEVLLNTNFLANYVIQFTTLKADDPNWVIPPVPYAVQSADPGEVALTLTLQNPVTLVSQAGSLVQLKVTDQEFPELPRTQP